ncbi:MAG: hypothetical protein M5U29_17705 [Anaerolineae bacterium]|nr:hypothetical protein [Anaerolineae bacterium]
MEIALLVLLLVIIGAALAWDSLAQRRYVARTAAAWTDAGQTVQGGPLRTISRGDLLAHQPGYRAFGALAVLDGRLVFSGHRSHALDHATPLEAVRWIGLRTRVKTAWNRRIETPELVIHSEEAGGWRVSAFIEGPVEVFAAQLGALTGLPVLAVGEAYEDFGPAPAVYVVPEGEKGWRSGVAGQPDPRALPPDWMETARWLYLAPDRLLFDRAHAIPLARIRRVVVTERGVRLDENPFDDNLLRVEYEDANGARRTAGFVVRNAGDWAGVLEARASVPVLVRGATGDK